MLTMAEVERKHILETIAQAGGVMQAAPILDMGKTTLYKKLKKWGVELNGRRCVVLEQAQVLLAVPTPRFLMLPRTKEEIRTADLKCPACKAIVLLPNGGKL